MLNEQILKDQVFWNKLAKRYAASPVRDEAAYEHTLARVRAYLEPDHTVLELGAGTGTTAVKLAPHVKSICASDLSSEMLEIAKERAAGVENVTVAVGAVEEAPEGPFDVVIAMNLFHLLPDLDAALRAAYQRLPEGGVFISKTPCLKDMKSLKWRLMLRALPLLRLFHKAPSVVRSYSVAEMDEAVARAGFEMVETGIFPADPPSRFIVARKRSSVD